MTKHGSPINGCPLNVLCLYNATQTFTNTVHDYLTSFKLSTNNWYFADVFEIQNRPNLIERFDVVAHHYSVRIAFLQTPSLVRQALSEFRGLKVLFIQDEYDCVSNSRQEIIEMGFQIVFTCVPNASIDKIYPRELFPGTSFISVLTGYVPPLRPSGSLPASQRQITIGYRGRALPIRYGRLAQEKQRIGVAVKDYCETNGISHDIECDESARLYGDLWTRFLSNCRAMLGTESGSNVFDFESNLWGEIDKFKARNPVADDESLYKAVIAHRELDGLMNQISPKIFEMILHGTACVLYPGEYSGILKPYEHYIPLNKDHSNLRSVMDLVMDDSYIDLVSQRAYTSVVESGLWSYPKFVELIDDALRRHSDLILNVGTRSSMSAVQDPHIRQWPTRAASPNVSTGRSRNIGFKDLLGRLVAWWGR